MFVIKSLLKVVFQRKQKIMLKVFILFDLPMQISLNIRWNNVVKYNTINVLFKTTHQ